jgi:Uncharacterised nucleotidyltransferase
MSGDRSACRNDAGDAKRPDPRAFAAAVIARETLKDVARELGRAEIPVMVLKGALLQLEVYASDPAQRTLTDVDVLVPEPCFFAALAHLRGCGFRPRSAGPSWIEAALDGPRGLPVDLHRRLFCPLRYGLTTPAVFQRARCDHRALGVSIWLPDPLDTAAHLIGKLVTDHVGCDAADRFADLEALARHHRLAPDALARHLSHNGLSRAARHVLGRGERERDDPLYAAALRHLPASPVDAAVAALVGPLCGAFERGPLAALPAHLLNTSLPRGAASFSLAALYALEHARLRRARGRRGGQWAPFFVPSNASARRRASSARAL